jgi:protoporphyrinogen oxidase
MGGHVIFSHYSYFDDLINAGIGGSGPDKWNTLQRESYVWIKQRWVAYPFQNNLAALPPDDAVTCLVGAAKAAVEAATATKPPINFDEWIMRGMGEGIADLFMRPYNFKVWAHPTTAMQCGWLGERVASVDVQRAIANVVHGREDAGWGPNAVFRFPTHGGTGAIWKGVARLLPADKQKYGVTVVAIDADNKVVTLDDGSKIEYNALISTIPLDTTLSMIGRTDLAAGLDRSVSHIVGVGLRGSCPHGSKCWLYFPEDDCPFYRATVFSNYAKANCPSVDAELPTLCDGAGKPPASSDPVPGPYWSLMFEVSESVHKPVDMTPLQLGGQAWPSVVADVLQGALATGLISSTDDVVSIYHRRLEHGYPTPSLTRDDALDKALPWLKSKNIWSRGRFGSWKYEVGNQDHSLMLGVEAADNVLFGTPEMTLNHSNIVNATRNEEPVYHRKGKHEPCWTKDT